METWSDLFSLADANVGYVMLGTLLLSASTAVVGTFSFLQRKALVGDAIAHAVLPGICLSFMFTGTKNPVYLTAGAFVTGWMALWIIDKIPLYSTIKKDTAIALVLSVMFGFGILLLTAIQHTGNAAQVGLSNFLFGNAAALVGSDLHTLAYLSAVILVTFFLLFKEFSLLTLDRNFAQTIG